MNFSNILLLKNVIMNACVKLNTYDRVWEHMTCDVILVVAILDFVLIYMVSLFPV